MCGDPTPDDDDVVDDEIDILVNNEIYESSKALIINKYNEEAKALRKESQKLTLNRQALLRSFHDVFLQSDIHVGLVWLTNQHTRLRLLDACCSMLVEAPSFEHLEEIKRLCRVNTLKAITRVATECEYEKAII